MINKDFYPTPDSVIRKMIEPFRTTFGSSGYRGSKIQSMQILEPSAGKGNILDFLKSESGVKASQLYSIESEPELQYILQGKGYKVIGEDFLSYTGDYEFDLILGNPPFSNGDEHLLKMWEVLNSGHIICLLNSETIKNPFSAKRKLIQKLIQDHGSVEHLGAMFTDAERKTSVETSIVRLEKKAKTKVQFSFDNITRESKVDFSEEIVGNTIAINDLTGSLIRSYEKTKEAYVAYIKAKREMEFYSKHLIPETSKAMSLADAAFQQGFSDNERYNLFVDSLKYTAWRSILSKMNIEKYLTASVLSNFQDFAKNQGCLDLTKENIHSLILMIIQNRESIMKTAIIDVFDLFTKYHTDNREHVEGWKTNECWIVGPKIILPHYIEMGYDGNFSYNHRKWDQFSDIEKVLCYMEGIDFTEIDKPLNEGYGIKKEDIEYVRLGLKNAIRLVKVGSTAWHESEFFLIRCYKKGTVHLKWKSEALRAKFNQLACDGKFNLPYVRRKRK